MYCGGQWSGDTHTVLFNSHTSQKIMKRDGRPLTVIRQEFRNRQFGPPERTGKT